MNYYTEKMLSYLGFCLIAVPIIFIAIGIIIAVYMVIGIFGSILLYGLFACFLLGNYLIGRGL